MLCIRAVLLGRCSLVYLSTQDHSREVGSPQQVPREPQGGKLLLQKPSSKVGGAARKSLHCGHQVSRCKPVFC